MVVTIDYTNVMYADFTIVALTFLAAIFWREQRGYLFGFGGLYLMATIGFHFGIFPDQVF